MRKPVYKRSLWRGVEVVVFGADRNWSIAGGSREEIDANNPGVVDDILEVMRDLKIKRVFAPKPAFNAKVALTWDLSIEVFPGFFRGEDADGVIIVRPGDAYMLSSADCLTGILYNAWTLQLAPLHCGRDALVDKEALLGNKPRLHPSVIDHACERLKLERWGYSGYSHLFAFLAAGIGPQSFTHPTTATMQGPDGLLMLNVRREENLRLIAHLQALQQRVGCRAGQHPIVANADQGAIDLVGLVQAQLMEKGILIENIQWDGRDTATDLDSDGNFLFHSHRRHDAKRNLVVVLLND